LATDALHVPLAAFALWSAGAATVLSAAIALLIAVLRARFARRARRESRFLDRWRPLLLESVDAVPAHIPTVKRPDWFAFLALWNHYQESLRGGGRHRLKAVAIRLRMDVAARRLLKEGSVGERLMAVVTLGHLGDHDSWNELEYLCAGEHPTLSLAAARSLLLIDAGRAMNVLVHEFTARVDWPLARLQSMLAEAGPAAVTPALVAAIDRTAAPRMPRLLALMDRAHGQDVTPRIRALIEHGSDDEVLVACLKSSHLPRSRELIADLTRHPSWEVRTQAARAFGLVAQPGDEKLLLGLLSDGVWWVRYRAALALTGLSFLSRGDLLRLRSTLADPFGRDMLSQVLAESFPA
jgi:hypothetical protein